MAKLAECSAASRHTYVEYGSILLKDCPWAYSPSVPDGITLEWVELGNKTWFLRYTGRPGTLTVEPLTV